jgi:spore protease
VKGQTGMESLEVIRGVVERTKPGCLIAVDALAAADAAHIGTVVQLSDAGIQPGSGVGNRRARLDKSALGIPVYALGVPTVTDLDEAGSGRIVTTADVDALVSGMAGMLAAALNRALQPGLSEAELEEFLM